MKRFFTSLFIFFLIAIPTRAHIVTFSGNALSLSTDQVSFIDISIDTEGRFINTIELYMTYDPDKLEVLDIISANSIIDLWVSQPRAENGSVIFIGGISGGAVVKEGTIGTLVVKGTQEGTSELRVDVTTSGVHLNDGLGTRESLQSSSVDVAFSDSSPQSIIVESPTHPEQDVWYRENDVRFVWEADTDDVYSYSFSTDFTQTPDDIPEEGTLAEFSDVADGIYYFTIKKQITNSTWTDLSRRRVLVDATPPQDFRAELIESADEFNGNSVLVFSTEDATSGVVQYDVLEGEKAYFDVTSPYVLVDTKASSYTVRAFDRAGNESFSTILFDSSVQDQSNELFYVIVGLIVFFLAIIVFRILYTNKDQSA